MAPRPGFAIVGMECIFLGAANLEAFWSNLRAGVDAITDVPEARWDEVFYDPGSAASDRMPCRRGGCIDAYARFDPLEYGIMPLAADQAEPDQLLALDVAARALEDAGYSRQALPRQGTGVVLGRGNYAGPGRVRLEQHVRMAEQLLRALRDLVPGVTEQQLAEVKQEFQSRIGAASGDAAIGLVPNLSASRIANRLDLDGPAYTVDAACASALVALDRACQDLESGRADVMLCGAVHVCQEVAFWSVLKELGAISPSGQIRPFDQRADGLLVSEGVGVLVLKRLADAERAGDRIYAVVRGTGLSSDGREVALMNPSVQGQLLALRRAWDQAGLDPRAVGLLEAHGTGTVAGDGVELETILRFFGGPRTDGPPSALGSVKSMIGHAMPAAGAAGLIKTALAVYHGVRPCTLHCERPREAMAHSLFEMQQRTAPWPESERIAAVNAFGFGGINAHAVLHSAGPAARGAVGSAPTARRLPGLLCVAADSAAGLLAALERGADGGTGQHRVAILDPTPARIERARNIVERGKALAAQGIYFTPRGLLADGGKLAFLHPGFDARFEPRIEALAPHFSLREVELPTEPGLEPQGIALMGVNRLMSGALQRLGLRPDLMAGQSIGEWSAMVEAGVVAAEAVDAFSSTLRPGSLDFADAGFAMLACGLQEAQQILEGLEEVEISHDNCPHQVIVCGSEGGLDRVAERMRGLGVLCQRLPFGSGVHSRFFTPHLPSHVRNIRRFAFSPPELPLYSATSAERYPAQPQAIAELAISHMVKPVRFRELVERLYADGARVFVQVGTGSLIGFVKDTLRERPHFGIAANVRQRGGREQLLHVAAALWAHGADPDIEALHDAEVRRSRSTRQLSLGVPMVRFERPLMLAPVQSAPSQSAQDPLAQAFDESMGHLSRAQAEVMAAFRSRGAAPRASSAAPSRAGELQRTRRLRLSLDAYPELADHAFFRQARGASTAERAPVVPMTGMIELMMREAQALAPDQPVVEVRDVRALHWLPVAQPLEVEVTARFDGPSRVDVRLGQYARAQVVLAAGFPPVTSTDGREAAAEQQAALDARQLYAEHWMFHGPAYQGVSRLGPLGTDGIRGELRAPAALGSLLDSAGQLLAYWVQAHSPDNRLMTPTAVRRIRFASTAPAAGEPVEARVKITSLESKRVQGDILLWDGRGLWAHIEGWEDRRFSTDKRLWELIRFPEVNLLSDVLDPGVAWFNDTDRAIGSREYLVGRYLSESEGALYEALPQASRRDWLGRRVAVKDAVRSFLRTAHPALFPAQVEVSADCGAATVRDLDRELCVATAARSGCWLAQASDSLGGVALEPFDGTPALGGALAACRARVAGRVAAAAAASRGEGELPVTRVADERFLTAAGRIRTACHGPWVAGWLEAKE